LFFDDLRQGEGECFAQIGAKRFAQIQHLIKRRRTTHVDPVLQLLSSHFQLR